MQRTVSWIWMNARVWPPVPCTVKRILYRRLHEKAIKHGAVIPIVVEAIDQPFIGHRFRSLGTPDDSLMQICYPNPVILVVEEEQELVLGLGQVVDTTRVGRIQDLVVAAGTRLHLRP